LDLVARSGNAALKATWYQKWLVHRRLRPDAFGGHLHVHLTGKAKYPIHQDILHSAALDLVNRRFGSYLLPQAYPDGCPSHPAYPAGHAALAGAFVTMLKAFFRSDFVIPNPKVPNDDGTELVPYRGPALTIGGELDKLASNISIGRDAAGVHWRSDATAGLALGEAVALGILRDEIELFNESFESTLTKFDGDTVTIKDQEANE
jgi:membrane-associated phospholipid phosphatase